MQGKACGLTKHKGYVRFSMQACENLNIQKSFGCRKKHTILFFSLAWNVQRFQVLVSFFRFFAVCEMSIKWLTETLQSLF